ncbi:MAG: radical SAM protein [Polyangiaceae bacterium]|nr:radical SAM protein [Polyangiaceae bacterium]
MSDADPNIRPDEILAVRRGPGANCSSIGSALDILYLSATFAGAVLAGVAAALGKHRHPPGPQNPPAIDKNKHEYKNPEPRNANKNASSLRARAEPFGAWARIDDSTLVAVARPAAIRLGLVPPPNSSQFEPNSTVSPPLEAHLAVTSRCGAGCKGCYLDARPDGDQPPLEQIETRLRAIAAAGVFTVALGGGEPLSRPDLGEIGAAARALGLVPVVTTSGIGMTPERAQSLRSFAQVNVSYDGDADGYEIVRGWDGARVAERAMSLLADAGVPFGVNVVLTRQSFPRLARTLERAEQLGAREAQLLRYKPAGRARGADYLAARLSNDQIQNLLPTLQTIASERSLGLRIDCAMVPLLSASPLDPALLTRFGVLGCEAGRHLSAVRIDGLIAPCSFASPSESPLETAFSDTPSAGWQTDPVLAAYRALPDIEPCRSCSLRDVCRGGCRIVAERAGAPDPECPRVVAHRKEHYDPR